MLIVHVDIKVKPESVAAFEQATLENARSSIQEPGIARFELLRRDDDPARFVLLEVYRDKDAPARHRETMHYKKWRDAVEDIMAEPRTRVIYANVFPPDESW